MNIDSPGSPLSDVRSDKFDEERIPHSPSFSSEPEDISMRPAKRQKVSKTRLSFAGVSKGKGRARSLEADVVEDVAPPEHLSDDYEDISSDTEGSVVYTPPPAGHIPTSVDRYPEDDADGPTGGREQITVCRWEDCEAGDLGNMDLLVEHIQDEHIVARQKKYSCEWVDCNRKGITQASGYALGAHMRSHTREKPFYCILPECDRSFTRSDALAKHMRTVHETEALRPSDPVPRNHSSNPQNKSQRLRLTYNKLSTGGTPESGIGANRESTPLSISDTNYENDHVWWSRDEETNDWVANFPPDIQFTDKELEQPPAKLVALCQLQIGWAIQSGEELETEVDDLKKTLEAERKENDRLFQECTLADIEEAKLQQEQEEEEELMKEAMKEAEEEKEAAEKEKVEDVNKSQSRKRGIEEVEGDEPEVEEAEAEEADGNQTEDEDEDEDEEEAEGMDSTLEIAGIIPPYPNAAPEGAIA